jgi:hypothetical protein
MYTTPGIYFEQVDRVRPALGLLRTDIAAMAGYTARGPLLMPVKVSGWRQFTAVFGDPLPYTFLPRAVQGFFDNGGAACYIVRVADPDQAKVAAAYLSGSDGATTLQVWASHGRLHDASTDEPLLTRRLLRIRELQATYHAPVVETAVIGMDEPARLDSPGAWANELAVSLQNASLGTTETDTSRSQPVDGNSSYVLGLSGIETGSIVLLSQNGVESYRLVKEINAPASQLIWDSPLTGFDLTRPILLESVEFSLFVLRDGQIVERFENVSISAGHSRFVEKVVQETSHLIDMIAARAVTAGDSINGDHLPVEAEPVNLAGGRDGLASVNKADFLAALIALQEIDEVSVLAIPDLVLPEQVETSDRHETPQAVDCEVLEPPPNGQLAGVVLEALGTADVPQAGVNVQVIGGPAQTTTDAAGEFLLTALPLEQVTLLLTKEGYHDLEVTAQGYTVLPEDKAVFYLSPKTLPPVFDLDTIFEVQTAMIAQGENGHYRVALLDPPSSMLGLEEIQTWRARFDTTYAALYYPWLRITDEGGDLVDVPPSGHVAGLIARTDLKSGVHRAPANAILENVKALTHVVNDAEQGLLNPTGINCIRSLPGRGLLVYGARTVTSNSEWRYLNVRRLLLMIEKTAELGHQWAVFEANDPILRQALTFSLGSFLNVLWRRGALAGNSPEAAYRVQCNENNNPPEVIDNGRLIVDVAVAPAIPFEFIKFRLGRTVEAVEVTERF